MNLEAIARTAHEVNRSYCLSLGDTSQPSWEDAPDWQKDSAIKGVTFLRMSPNAGVVAIHHNWVMEKVLDGWVQGPVKDAHAKQHPCLVPFESLPKEQQAKDYLFVGTVRALLPLLEPEGGGSYAMIYLADGEMPGTMKQEVKFDDANVFNPASHAHQHIKLLCDYMADIAQRLDPVTLQPMEKVLQPTSEQDH